MPPDNIRDRIRQKSNVFKRVFSNPDGLAVLDLLEKEFDKDSLMGHNRNQTYFNLGQRDVVIYIKQMLRYGNDDRVEE